MARQPFGQSSRGCYRYVIRLLLLALSCAATAGDIYAQSASRLDAPVPGGFKIYDPALLRPCHLGMLIDQVAQQAEVPVGIEVAHGCGFGRSVVFEDERAVVLSAQSAREAFDELMEFAPDYLWVELDGVAVFRPVKKWADRQSVFRAPVAAFEVEDTRLHDVVQTILTRATPPLLDTDWIPVPQPVRAIDTPVSMSFRGGTLLEALNSTVRSGPGLVWYLVHEAEEGEAHVGVAGRTLPAGQVAGMMRRPR